MEETAEYVEMVCEQINLLTEFDAKFALAIVAKVCPDTFRHALAFLD